MLIVDRVDQNYYITVGSEKSSNQCRAGKTLVSYHRTVGKQGRCFPFVKSTWPFLGVELRTRVKNAIKTCLTTTPHLYGEPLWKNTSWLLEVRVGDYRVVFKIVAKKVWILGIIHRKKVYEAIKKEVLNRPYWSFFPYLPKYLLRVLKLWFVNRINSLIRYLIIKHPHRKTNPIDKPLRYPGISTFAGLIPLRVKKRSAPYSSDRAQNDEYNEWRYCSTVSQTFIQIVSKSFSGLFWIFLKKLKTSGKLIFTFIGAFSFLLGFGSNPI